MLLELKMKNRSEATLNEKLKKQKKIQIVVFKVALEEPCTLREVIKNGIQFFCE